MTAAPGTAVGPAASPVAGPAAGAAAAGRADARRNREIVLRTAVRAFADEGLEVSLGRIAQQAGVGAGTVYRHFPSKEVLLEAVLAEQVDRMAVAAGQWAARAAPGDALFGFLLEVIEKSAGRQHVCDALAPDKGWPRALLTAASQRFRAGLDRLLRDAKQAGAVRADLRADDLSALAFAGAALCSAHRDPARGLRLARLLLDGLRPPAGTKAAGFRDAHPPTGHETPAGGVRHCEECGARLRLQVTGRPALYCGPACRQRARRRRLAG
jgi:AcrR family transcriptional regulator